MCPKATLRAQVCGDRCVQGRHFSPHLGHDTAWATRPIDRVEARVHMHQIEPNLI